MSNVYIYVQINLNYKTKHKTNKLIRCVLRVESMKCGKEMELEFKNGEYGDVVTALCTTSS